MKSDNNSKTSIIKKTSLLLFLVLLLMLFFFAGQKYSNYKKSNKANLSSVKKFLYMKPLLYLYPKKETKVTVTFDDPSKIKTSYPIYKDKWKITANSKGVLEDKNRNEYYALYWEESGTKNIDFKKGYYVTKDDAMQFLEDKLKYIGLNDRERNEFIIYWLPVLEENEKSVVYFELTDERQAYNKIKISPKPDSLLRFAMHVKKVDKKPNDFEKQKLSHFNRKGFSAIEWGGVIHN